MDDAAETPGCRPAVAADLPGIAEARVLGWQRAYRGLVPQDYLDALDVEAEARQRLTRFGTGPATDHVAVVAGRVVGWTAVGPYQPEHPNPAPGAGEVYALYVHPDQWSRGAGRALLAHGLAELAATGLAPVLLWVLAVNDRARRFYAAAGFAPDGARQMFAIGGAEVPQVRYRYSPA